MATTDWLKDESNQKLLKFLGGAVVACAVAGWTAYTTLFPKDAPKPAAAPVAASASAVVPVSAPVAAPANVTVTATSGTAVNVSGSGNQISIGR